MALSYCTMAYHKYLFTLRTSDFLKATNEAATHSHFIQGKLHDSKCSYQFHYAYWKMRGNILVFYGA